jgi:hypothetical protein
MHDWQFRVIHCFSVGQLWRTAFHAPWSSNTLYASCSCLAWQSISWSLELASRTTDWPLLSLSLTSCHSFLWVRSNKKSVDQIVKTLWNGTINSRHFSRCSSWFDMGKCRICAFRLTEVCAKRWVPCWNLTLHGSRMGFKMVQDL